MRSLLVFALVMLCASSCSDGDFSSSNPARVWVAIEPIQCLGNPWERDWHFQYFLK